MPSDSRRNYGPDDSQDYHLFIQDNLKSQFTAGKRSDGRTCEEQRKIYLKTGVCLRVKGSCYLEAGQTKLLATATEPKEIPRQHEFSPYGELACEFKYAPFSGRTRRSFVPDADEKHLALILRRALEPAVCRHEFPNFQVEVNILVLDNGGGVLSSAIVAAGLALADAGIPMYDTISSVSMVIFKGQFYLDPNFDEEMVCSSDTDDSSNSGLVCIASLSGLNQISLLHFDGAISHSILDEKLNFLLEKCQHIADLVKLRLVKDVELKLKEEEGDVSN